MGSGSSKPKTHPRRQNDAGVTIRVKETKEPLPPDAVSEEAHKKDHTGSQSSIKPTQPNNDLLVVGSLDRKSSPSSPSQNSNSSSNSRPDLTRTDLNTSSNRPETESGPLSPSPFKNERGQTQLRLRSHRPRTAPRKLDRQKTTFARSKGPVRPGTRGSNRTGPNAGRPSSYKGDDNPCLPILNGDMNAVCPSTAKIVRVFTSSTFTDTEQERNALMERVYPRLREKCHQLGYEFQVVDMRWGVRDEATDDHMTTDLCLREIDLCMKLSTGPCFVTFLSHKYGYRPLPNRINAEEFEVVISGVTRDADRELINRWYQEDENAIPSTFVLHPISSHLPDYLCDEDNKRQVALNTWYSDSDTMKVALEEAARNVLDAKRAHCYMMSVTEQEIAHALFTPENMAGRSAWFDRRIRDIDKVRDSSDNDLFKYKDIRGSKQQNEEAQDLLHDLRDKKLPIVIPHKCHVAYSVPWSEKGIEPVRVREHKAYIDQLCTDFEFTLMGMVNHGIKSRSTSNTDSEIFQEAVQHLHFCHQRCSSFHGRDALLKTIGKYITSSATEPLVVHGVSGSGKTSVVAMAAKQAWEAMAGDCAVIIRFIGTTPDSSSITSLLRSVTSQLWTIYGYEGHDFPNDLKELTSMFHEALELADGSKPLVLVLDSLDQLDDSDFGRHLTWVPARLPKDVKMIVSTLPDAQYECLNRLQAKFPSRGLFVQVPKLPDDDAMGILGNWLQAAKRRLTPAQRDLIHEAFQKCPLPLYLKLVFEDACKWRSFTPTDKTVLEITVRGCIKALFFRIERAHGRLFVSRALGYLTLSRSGLTESELEDILSSDDDVLNDVYMYWTPPIRRLPPLLLVRLRTELDHYMVDKGADGVRVFFWYHRQFIEAAHDRYCSEASLRQQMHGTLGDFFSGAWANGKEKAYTNKEGEQLKADRHVSAQPLRFDDTYNFRLLNNLPYHRLRADQGELLKKECLCNFPFLQAKLTAAGLRHVLEDFRQARSRFDDDTAISTIGEALQLSQGALMKHPYELPSQLLGRIQEKKELRHFLQQCGEATAGYLVANQPILTRPGGQLVHCLAGHKAEVTGLAITCDGEYAVTCSNDKSMKIWDVYAGKLHRSIEGIGEDPDTIRLCCNDRLALVNPDGAIQAYEIITGNRKYIIDVEIMKAQYCAGGQGDTTLGVFMPPKSIRLYRAVDGKLMKEVDCPFAKADVTIGDFGPSAGCGNYMVNVDTEQKYLFVFDVGRSAFTFMQEAFPALSDDEREAKEEFLSMSIDAVALIDDGKKVVLSSMYNSDLHIYDCATMTLLQVINGLDRDMAERFHVTPDCRYLYFASKSYVVAWDMTSSERSAILEQPTTYRDVVTADMEVIVTTGEEHVVKIWDLSRETSSDTLSEPQQSEGFVISHFCPLEHPRYVVIFGIHSNSKRYFKVHDLVTCTDIRKLQVNADIQDLVAIDTHRVLVRVGRKLKIVDFSNMSVTVTFEGKLPLGSYGDFRVIKQGKEVVSVSRGRHNVKIYNTNTGKVTQLVTLKDDQRILCLLVNKNSTTLVARTEDGSYLFCDLTTYKFAYKFDPVTFNFKDTYTDDACVSDDGRWFVFSGERYNDEYLDDSPPHRIFVWNIKNRTLEREMTDHDTYEKFLQTGDAYYDTGIDNFIMLTPTTVLANLNDGAMRVFDISTGEVTITLQGHSSSRMCMAEWSPYIITRGTWTEDQTLRIVDRQTMKPVASYTPDFTLSDLSITLDGHHVVGYFPNYPDPVMWTLKGTDSTHKSYKPLSSFKNTFGDKVKSFVALLQTKEDDNDDPSDPDKDIDETEDDMIEQEDADFLDCLSDEEEEFY